MGKFAASKLLVKESWAILRQDKEIMLFPLASVMTSIVVLGLLCGAYLTWVPKSKEQVAAYVGIFVVYLVQFFIVNFYQAGILLIAHARFNGRNLSFGEGISAAFGHSRKLFFWALLSATVGVILHIISDKSKLLGKIVVSLLGSAWNILTYFSLPSLIIGDTTVTGAFKESAAIIKKTWGETLIINIGVSLYFMAILVAEIILGIVVLVLFPYNFVFVTVFAVFFLSIIFLSILGAALDAIFKLALYEYARTGTVPSGFSPALIQAAVKK